jgi:hypothetical protein
VFLVQRSTQYVYQVDDYGKRRDLVQSLQQSPRDVRRGFFDGIATPIVARINQLFAIDAEAREQGLSLEHCRHLRKANPGSAKRNQSGYRSGTHGPMPVNYFPLFT